jgi:hypothetical protein
MKTKVIIFGIIFITGLLSCFPHSKEAKLVKVEISMFQQKHLRCEDTVITEPAALALIDKYFSEAKVLRSDSMIGGHSGARIKLIYQDPNAISSTEEEYYLSFRTDNTVIYSYMLHTYYLDNKLFNVIDTSCQCNFDSVRAIHWRNYVKHIR